MIRADDTEHQRPQNVEIHLPVLQHFLSASYSAWLGRPAWSTTPMVHKKRTHTSIRSGREAGITLNRVFIQVPPSGLGRWRGWRRRRGWRPWSVLLPGKSLGSMIWFASGYAGPRPGLWDSEIPPGWNPSGPFASPAGFYSLPGEHPQGLSRWTVSPQGL